MTAQLLYLDCQNRVAVAYDPGSSSPPPPPPAPIRRLEGAFEVQITEAAAGGYRPPTHHFDPPSARQLVRLVIAEIGRPIRDLYMAPEPDGRVVLRSGHGDRHLAMAYITGLPIEDAMLAFGDLWVEAGR